MLLDPLSHKPRGGAIGAVYRDLIATGKVNRTNEGRRPFVGVHVANYYRPITDEGVAFDSDTAIGMMPIAHSRRRCAIVLAIVTVGRR